MGTVLVENIEDKQRVYESLMLDSKHLGIFSSELAVGIINELAKQSMCAMDVAKKLKQNEQKVYYHLRKMRDAGIVKLNGTEQRYGMTAKMFQLVSPVIATKLYDEGYDIKAKPDIKDPRVEKFFEPFIIDGKLNCKIIIGDSYPHGKYDTPATEGPYAFDFALLLGKMLDEMEFPNYSIDTDNVDMNSNMILIGNARTNVVIDKLNDLLPVHFDLLRENRIVVKHSGNTYSDPRFGVIMKTTNPSNKKKKILLIGGVRTRGMQAAVIAITKYISKVVETEPDDGTIIKIVEGYDGSGNKRIDSVKFAE